MQLLHAVLARQSLIAISGEPHSGKTRLLNAVAPLLAERKVRVVRVGSPDQQPLDLRHVLRQVLDAAPDGRTGDPTERISTVLTRPRTDERQVALLIDDAHALTDDALGHLGRIASAAVAWPLPLQLVLAGRPEMWERLPAQGGLSAERVETRLVLGRGTDPAVPEDEPGSGRASHDREPGSGPFDELFEPGAWALLPEIPAAARDPVFGAAPGATDLQPRATLTAPSQADVGPSPRRRAGRAAWAMLALGLVVAVGAALWEWWPIAPVSGRAPPLLPTQVVAARPSSEPGPPLAVPEHTVAGEPRRAAAAPAEPAATEPQEPTAALRDTSAPDTSAPDTFTGGDQAVPAAPSTAVALPPSVQGMLARGDALLAAGDPAAARAMYTQAVQAARDAAPDPGTAPAESAPAGAPPRPAPPADLPPEPVETRNPAATDPPPLAPAPPPSPPTGALVQILLDRGNALLATGDVMAARLMYERAALSDSAAAAIAAGTTYDPGFLAQIGARGIAPDPQAAAAWYRRAAALGDTAGTALLARLGIGPGLGE